MFKKTIILSRTNRPQAPMILQPRLSILAFVLTSMLALPLCAESQTGASLTPVTNPVLKERDETPSEHDARMAWWREGKFGLFIHWGLYAQLGGMWQGKDCPGGYKEWIMYNSKISIADYAAVAKDFNPVQYDAEKWVLAAKSAGMKYMVLTSKHHDGFAMFKSDASPFNIVDATPFHRDPLKELAAACRKHGMKLGVYYSQNYDWHHPGGALNNWDPASKGNYDTYIDTIVIPHLRELLKNYGEIAVLWFDMGGGTQAQAARIQKAVLECNPKIIMNSRLGGGFHGDTETPEQNIPANGYPGKDWETCMTMNSTWGYGKNDHGWKSVPELLGNLCQIVGKGGNYLLNVGPNELGEIPAPSLDRLAEVGAWMKINGEAIYGTFATPFPHSLPWGAVTRKDKRLFLLVSKLPADRKLTMPELTTPIACAYYLADNHKSPLPITRADTGFQTITIPEATPVSFGGNPVVIVAELQGCPIATLLDFTFPGMPAATLAGNQIRVAVPLATDLTKLAPSYHTGSPLVTGKPESGATLDFTRPQAYVITAPDGTSKTYQVTVTPTLGAVGVGNPGFEKFDCLSEWDEHIGRSPTGAIWNFRKVKDDWVGISCNDGPMKMPVVAPPSPDGSVHSGFLRGQSNSISQTIQFDEGNYTVSFDVASSGRSKTAVPLVVSVDGAPVLALEAEKITNAWVPLTSPAFKVTSGSHTLAFTAGDSGNNPGTDLIDNVAVKYCK